VHKKQTKQNKTTHCNNICQTTNTKMTDYQPRLTMNDLAEEVTVGPSQGVAADVSSISTSAQRQSKLAEEMNHVRSMLASIQIEIRGMKQDYKEVQNKLQTIVEWKQELEGSGKVPDVPITPEEVKKKLEKIKE
jgi:hypothetical protein